MLVFSVIMANNTLGEWSDGEDEWIFGIDEGEQTGRGVKRKAENQNDEQEQDYYQIKPIREHHSQKFNMTAKNYGVHFNNVLDNVDLLESRKRTYGIFDHLIKDVTEGMNPNDQVRFVLSSNQLQTPIAIPFCSLEELTTEKVLSHVEKVVQSNEEFRLNTTVNIDVIRVEMPHGSGKSKRTTLVVMYQVHIRNPTRQPTPNRQNTRQSAKTHAPIPQPRVPRNMVHENDV